MGILQGLARYARWVLNFCKAKVVTAKKVIVTGGTGLLGYALVPGLLKANAEVLILSRQHETKLGFPQDPRLTIHTCNLADFSQLESVFSEFQPDTVFHLAANNNNGVPADGPFELLSTNLIGSLNLLEIARRQTVPPAVLIASSIETEYPGAVAQDTGREKLYPYQASKLSIEMLARSFHDCYGLKTLVLRLSNIYGGGDLNFRRLIPSLALSIVRGQTPALSSNGAGTRDFLYVEDAARAFLMAMHHESILNGGIVSIYTGLKTSLSAIVAMLCDIAGIPSGASPTQRPSQLQSSLMVSPNPLGWAPDFSVYDGLVETLQWYRQHKDWLETYLTPGA